MDSAGQHFLLDVVHQPHKVSPQENRYQNGHDGQRKFPEKEVRVVLDTPHRAEVHSEIACKKTERKEDDGSQG